MMPFRGPMAIESLASMLNFKRLPCLVFLTPAITACLLSVAVNTLAQDAKPPAQEQSAPVPSIEELKRQLEAKRLELKRQSEAKRQLEAKQQADAKQQAEAKQQADAKQKPRRSCSSRPSSKLRRSGSSRPGRNSPSCLLQSGNPLRPRSHPGHPHRRPFSQGRRRSPKTSRR